MSVVTLSDNPKVKARKQHTCYYCNEEIPVGTVYGNRTGVSYGEIWTMKFHNECDDRAVSEGWDEGDYECFSAGSMKRPAAQPSREKEGDK